MNKKDIFHVWKILLTVFSFIMVIITKSTIDWNNIMNNYVDFKLLKEIAYDLSVGVFSAMILIWFIDEINEYIQEKKNKENEIEEIKRANGLLQLYIERYKTFFYCVMTPMGQRDFNNMVFHKEFKLKDMKELHKTTLLVGEGHFGSSVESFLAVEEKLRLEIETIIKEINFDYYPQLRDCLIEFVVISIKYNQKKAILEAKNIRTAGGTLDVEIEKLLENNADDFYKEILSGKQHGGNLMHPYIFLYEMMRLQCDVIKKYEIQIGKILEK